MRCDGFDTRLQNLMDRRRAPDRDPRLREHAGRCERCRHQLQAAVRLLNGLELLEVPALSDDFSDRVLQQLSCSLPPAPVANKSATRILAMAATLLLAVLPAVWVWNRSDHMLLTQRSSAGASVADEGRLVWSGEAWPDRGEEQGWWVVPPELIQDWYPEATRERHRQRMSELAEELRPMALPFNAAVSALRWTLPVGRTRDKGDPSASRGSSDRFGRWS